MKKSGRLFLHKGFSVVELIIVVAVIGILTTLVVVSYGAVRSQADQNAVKSELQTAYDQLRLHIASQNGRLPATLEDADIQPTELASFVYWPISSREYCFSARSTSSAVSYYTLSDGSATLEEGACDDISWVAGTPIAYNDTPGTIAPFSRTLTQNDNITMYVALDVINTASAWDIIANLTPDVHASNKFQFDTAEAGSSFLRYRMDLPGEWNLTAAFAARTPGFHTGWAFVNAGITQRGASFDSLTPIVYGLGGGRTWTFSGAELQAIDSSTAARAIVVYDTLHTDEQKAAVQAWLTQRFDVD